MSKLSDWFRGLKKEEPKIEIKVQPLSKLTPQQRKERWMPKVTVKLNGIIVNNCGKM